MSKWTDDEREILMREFPTGGVTACAPLLPNRSKAQISAVATHLGLKSHRVIRKSNAPQPDEIPTIKVETPIAIAHREWVAANNALIDAHRVERAAFRKWNLLRAQLAKPDGRARRVA